MNSDDSADNGLFIKKKENEKCKKKVETNNSQN